MDFKTLVDEFNTYASSSYKPFADRFSDKRWDDRESVWILRKNELCFSQIKVGFIDAETTLSLTIRNNEAFEELKSHAEYIRNSYGFTVGYNQECLCKSAKDTDWNDDSAKIAAFDWIIMNAQMLQDIVDRYLSDFEAKETRKRQQRREAIAQKSSKSVTVNQNEDYETQKVFAETNRKTGVRYKIIHRKSQSRYEIWTSDHGKRNRVNNSEVEKIKQDKDAMIQYVKNNLLK